MLGAIRKGVSSIFVMLLMGLLIISFAIWGIGDVFRFGGGNAIALVKDIKISPAEFSQQFQNEVNRIQQQFGADITPAQARELGLGNQVLQRMVNRALFDQAARDLNMRASDQQVFELIHENPAFKNSFGEFDMALYQSILRYAGMTVPEFEAAARADVTREQLLATMAAAAHVPEDMKRRLFAYQGEERVVEVARFPLSDVKLDVTPSDEDLRAYYEENRERYMAPEYRSLSLVTLSADDFADDVTISDEDLQAYYEANDYQYSVPERREIEQMVLGSEAEAREAHDRISAGVDFASVAKEALGLSGEDLKLGKKSREELDQELGAAASAEVFALQGPGVTQPVQSDFGWHIFNVTAIEPGSTREFATVRDEIEKAVRHEKALDILYEYANRIEDDLAAGTSLADIAAGLGVDLRRIPAVDANGLTPAGERVDFGDAPGILADAFARQQGSEVTLEESSQDHYYLLSIDDVTPTEQRPFEEVQQTVLQNWTAEQRDSRARAAAEAARDRAAGAKSLADAGLDQVQSGLRIARMPTPTTANVTPEIRAAAFETTAGGAAVARAADGYVLVKVTEVIPGDAEIAGPLYVEFARGMDFQYGNDALTAYQGYLARKYEVRFNESLLNETLNQIASSPL